MHFYLSSGVILNHVFDYHADIGKPDVKNPKGYINS